ncbi:MAG TPA: carboxypeptidase-like regulatory domain-containing protein [Acidobacteriota bacterium]|nr:carboxypeptidase-like regulatory domain-containing protein [Acidobacteriota bacterium]
MMERKHCFSAIVLLASALAISAAQHPASRESSVFGRVFDVDGSPLAGAWVIVEDGQGRVRRRARTDAEGEYVFDCLPDGEYVLRFSAQGHLTQSVEHVVYRYPRKRVVQQVLNLDVSQEEDSMLVVRVRRSETSKGVAGAEVAVREAERLVFVKTTDECGRTHFPLHPGRFQIDVSRQGFQSASRQISMARSGRTVVVELKNQSPQRER